MRLADMKIGRKLGVGFACVLIAVALMSATLVTTLKSLNAAADVSLASYQALDDVDLAIDNAREESRAGNRYILTRNEQYSKLYDEAVKSFAANVAAARKDAAGQPEVLGLIDKIETAGDTFRRDFGDETMRLVRDNPTSDAAAKFVATDTAVAAFEDFKAAAFDARQKINAWSEAAQARFDHLMSALQTTVLAGCGAAILLAALVGWWMSRIIATPVTNMTSVMKKLAGGDHSIEIPGLGRKDEIGSMAEAVEAFKKAALAKVKRDAAEAESIKVWQKEDEERAAKTAEEARQDQIAITGLAEGLGRLAGGDLAYRIETPFAPKTAQLRADFNAAA